MIAPCNCHDCGLAFKPVTLHSALFFFRKISRPRTRAGSETEGNRGKPRGNRGKPRGKPRGNRGKPRETQGTDGEPRKPRETEGNPGKPRETEEEPLVTCFVSFLGPGGEEPLPRPLSRAGTRSRPPNGRPRNEEPQEETHSVRERGAEGRLGRAGREAGEGAEGRLGRAERGVGDGAGEQGLGTRGERGE